MRLAARREKKKIKSDAKKQRKENDLLHRRKVCSMRPGRKQPPFASINLLLQARNNEKYSKSKDRNRQRTIDLERSKIRNEAVRQAERLAAKYDPSGKSFNVGEVVILEDGTVKAKKRLQKKTGEEENDADVGSKKERKAAKAQGGDPHATVEGADLESVAEIQPRKHISNTQKKKQEMYAPKPVPPRPIIPDGVVLPRGEENMIALWDITDEEITRRLHELKKKKGKERTTLRKQQQIEKKFRRAMKAKKKQAINQGVDFDPEKAAKDILEEQSKSKSGLKLEPSADSDSESGRDSDSDSDSGTDSDSSPDSDSESEIKEIRVKSQKKSSLEVTNGGNEASGKPKTKKIKRSKTSSKDITEPTRIGYTSTSKKKEKKGTAASNSEFHPTPDAIEKIVKKEKERAKKQQKHLEKVNKTIETAELVLNKQKKRKRPKAESEDGAVDKQSSEKSHKKKKAKVADTTMMSTEQVRDQVNDVEPKPEKSHKHKKTKVETDKPASAPTERSAAGQWNPDALTGDELRRAKFLRLLGATKSNGPAIAPKSKSHTDAAEITKVQTELERQYEAGMKLKHDGGSKRRGIGA